VQQIVWSNFMANATVGIRIDADTQNRLRELGKRRDRSPHYLMKQAVEQFLTRAERDEAELQLMQERWRNFELTGHTLAHEEVVAWAQELHSDPVKR
jgi:predicted transcriptional regulator